MIKKGTIDMFVRMKMAFYLCATMSLFAGSYDTTTHIGIPWQVPTQGTNADRCTGDQLQVANMANQGNAYGKETYWCGHEIKLARMAKTYELYEKMQDLHAARGIRRQPCTRHQRRTQVSL